MMAGILKPHSILKVNSPSKNATMPAITKPGSNPREPMISNNLCLAAIFLKGFERPEVTYADRKGKYMGQKGVTLPKV